MKSSCSLQELQLEIKQALSASMPQRRWVTAEISEMNTNYSGHCYLELIERKASGNDICAKVRATIWAHNFRLLKAYFETTANTSLQRGIKVLVCVSVEYHEVWGISLNITDIDPVYTIGEQAKRRQQIIAQLEADGIIDMNKEQPLPLVVQRIAVISSATAAGYGDFVNQLQGNEYGYYFTHTLFPAAMQGSDTETSVIAALDAIYEQYTNFDVVVLIRGGGSQSDLSSFDSYDIASNIAQFPLPVFTGIGHERDDTVADLVAHTRLKTPTAVAEHIIGFATEFEAQINEYFDQITSFTQQTISDEWVLLQKHNSRIVTQSQSQIAMQQRRLLNDMGKIGTQAQRKLTTQHNLVMRAVYAMQGVKKNTQLELSQLTQLEKYIQQKSKKALHDKMNALEHLEEKIRLLDPQRLLEQGYSITLDEQGKVIRSTKNTTAGQRVQIRLHDGTIRSVVE